MPDWVLIIWITIGSGSLQAQKMTEAQCKAAIAEYEKAVDPLMAYCFGPKGQTVRTSDVRDRMRRLLPTNPKGGPAQEKSKAAGGI